MQQVKNLSLDEMVVKREVNPERVSYFADLMKEKVTLPPVLVDADRIVIDGHARVLAAQKLGLQVIPGVVATSLEDAVFCLTLNRQTERMNPARVYDLYIDLKPLLHLYALAARGKSLPRSRDLLAESLGIKESTLGCITAFYGNVYGPRGDRRRRAREIQEKVESGERTAAWAIEYVGRGGTVATGGTVTDQARQREILNHITGALSGTLRGLYELNGISPDLKTEELRAWRESLAQSRKTLTQFIKLLEGRINV